MNKLLFGLLGFALFAIPSSAIDTNGPANHGQEVTVDLPTKLHRRNTASFGLGNCVFTSVHLAAVYQNVHALQEFPKWIIDSRIPGGAGPDKLDDCIRRICKDRGVPAPDYVQHVGGDTQFLKLALKTGRYPCVTYDGMDDFYAGQIAHMVNLVHLSDTWAVIQDNNRPGQYTWLTVSEFESRWTGGGGGWAVVLLGPPPSPIPYNKTQKDIEMNSLLFLTALIAPGQWGDQCAPVRSASTVGVGEQWHTTPGSPYRYLFRGTVQVGCELGGEFWSYDAKTRTWSDKPVPKECICKKGSCECKKCPNDCVASKQRFEANFKGNDPFPGGVQADKLAESPEYTRNGKPCTKLQAYTAVGGGSLTDDSTKRTLTVVADDATIKKVLSDLDSHPTLVSLKGKFHVNAYTPDHWVVQQVGLAPGVTLQEAPDSNGKAPVIWRFRAYAGPEALAEAIRKADPNYKPENDPDPMNQPAKPVPLPVAPNDTKPHEAAKAKDEPITIMGVLGVIAFFMSIGLAGHFVIFKK